ncbi:ABC transporter substrate-binding protein [Streptomyces sp. NPDC089919]|uniref:ABC transporter substrate-binding protein n=1 Tax=Streptomyces sp. NPDC089919 TaxID=3155188 RepID=UPI003434A981
MARTRVRIPSLALTAALAAVALLTAGCGDSDDDAEGTGAADGPRVVVTTSWEGAFAKAAGARNIKVIVPQSVHHAPDYDPKPSDLAAVAAADFVLYAPFEPYAAKIKEAAGSKAKLVEVNLDNSRDKAVAEVTRLGGLFGTAPAATAWKTAFEAEYAKLSGEVKAAWPGGRAPSVVNQVFSGWSAELAGATSVGTYGPEPVTPRQLAELSAKKPALVLDNAHMTTGTVLPGSGAEQVEIVNYPGEDLDLLPVYRNAARDLEKALGSAS